MSVKIHNLLALVALVVFLLIVIVGGCPFAWAVFGWFCGAAMAVWGLGKLAAVAGSLVA